MYLARFSDGADDFVQGLVRLRYLAPLHGDNWNECAERLTGVVGGLVELESARVALRVNLPTRGAPEAVYSVLAPASKEPALRHVLAAFTRLDRISPGSIALPPARESFDEWAFSFPPLQANVNSCGMRAGSIWFACNFRVRSLLTRVLREAAALGYSFGYQVQVQRFSARRDQIREARINAEHAADLPGISPELVEAQKALAAGLSTAIAVHEEFVGVADPEAAQWLTAFIRRSFRAGFPDLRVDPPDLSLKKDRYSDVVAAGVFRSASEDFSIDELCSSALQPKEILDVLTWWPSALDFPLPAADEGVLDRPIATTGPLPPQPSDMPGNYIFISYQHGDSEKVLPLIQLLQGWDVPVWYDRNIPGAVEWDAWLEDRLSAASLVLLCLSPGAVGSRYVRREVKYADALGKPVLAVKLEDTELAHGFAMLLTQYQMLDTRTPGFAYDLERSVHLHLKSAR